jgi:hypothetical protein
MSVVFEMSYWNSFNEALDENGVSCLLFKSMREFYILISQKMIVKGVKIVLFDIEVDLID